MQAVEPSLQLEPVLPRDGIVGQLVSPDLRVFELLTDEALYQAVTTQQRRDFGERILDALVSVRPFGLAIIEDFRHDAALWSAKKCDETAGILRHGETLIGVGAALRAGDAANIHHKDAEESKRHSLSPCLVES